jgi:hypothetical protein
MSSSSSGLFSAAAEEVETAADMFDVAATW